MADLIRNKKAWFHYEILERFEAGAVLTGFEVKALKRGRGSLEGAYVVVRGGEAYLKGAHIPPYQSANTPRDYNPERERKLLLHKHEAAKLAAAKHAERLTTVPLRWYNKNSFVKLEIALVRGKKKADKRETLKERTAKRHIERTLKTQY